MFRVVNLIVACALCAAAFSAVAQVRIDDNEVVHAAWGRLATAAAYNPNAYIYAWLYGNSLYFGAADGTGKYASCSTSDPAFKRLFPMMRKISGVQFFWNASTGVCDRIDVFNSAAAVLPSAPGAMKAPTPVYVDATNRYAYGTVAVTAGSTNQAIGCTAQSFGSIYCTAQDQAGNFVWCSASRDGAYQALADQMLAAQGINESSLVYFSWDNDPATPTRTCNFLYTQNASYYVP
jgi:hypothetical protein